MPVNHPELELEQRHVDAAYAALERAGSRARDGVAEAAAADSTISRSAHLDREALMEVFLRRAARLRTGDQPLVFGRIDSTEESLHIGRLGLADESGERLVVDWRTPVAEPFYRATPLDTLGLRRRRHLHCRGARVVGLDDDFFDEALKGADDLVLVGEAALLASITRSRTGRMRNIVPTIQREQDAVIRAPLDQTLVVQGGPGTGKTVVALHRAAFLLYTYRHRLKGRPVLVVGPNPLFLRYIEDVLPELGEDQVRLATAGELVAGVSVTGNDAADVAQLKGDPRMAAVIARAIERRRRGLGKDLVVWHDSQPLHLTADASAAMVVTVAARDEPHNTGRRELHKALLRRLYDIYCDMAADAGAGDVTERIPFYEDVAHQPRLVAALDEMWPLLTPATVLGDLLRDEAVLATAAGGVLDDDEVALLLDGREPGAMTAADVALLDETDAQLGPVTVARKPAPSAVRAELLHEIEQQALLDAGDVGYLAYDPDLKEDVLDVVRARFAADFPEPAEDEEMLAFGHVVVDEAQDLSPMQWRMLGRRCPSGSMTIVGDLQQSLAGSGAGSWEAALAHLPPGVPRATATLSVNYRTPAEIMTLAESFVRDDVTTETRVRSVRESGRQPRFVTTSANGLRDAVRDALAGLRDDVGDGRIAVIHPASARAWVHELVPPCHDPLEALDAAVAAFTVDEVRGLEFDGVVVVEPTAIAAEHHHGRHALYVAVTRAVQALAVVHTTDSPWPP
jgi:DNA helicase IV